MRFLLLLTIVSATSLAARQANSAPSYRLGCSTEHYHEVEVPAVADVENLFQSLRPATDALLLAVEIRRAVYQRRPYATSATVTTWVDDGTARCDQSVPSEPETTWFSAGGFQYEVRRWLGGSGTFVRVKAVESVAEKSDSGLPGGACPTLANLHCVGFDAQVDKAAAGVGDGEVTVDQRRSDGLGVVYKFVRREGAVVLGRRTETFRYGSDTASYIEYHGRHMAGPLGVVPTIVVRLFKPAPDAPANIDVFRIEVEKAPVTLEEFEPIIAEGRRFGPTLRIEGPEPGQVRDSTLAVATPLRAAVTEAEPAKPIYFGDRALPSAVTAVPTPQSIWSPTSLVVKSLIVASVCIAVFLVRRMRVKSSKHVP